jgi:hypothetical protein
MILVSQRQSSNAGCSFSQRESNLAIPEAHVWHFVSRGVDVWQRKNMNWDTFADELNRDLFIVGAPVRFLPAALGCSKLAVVNSSRKQRVGDVGLETSDDGLKVKQFRFYYHNREGLEESTPWEFTDRRKAVTYDPRFLSRESEIHNFQTHRSIYLHPFIPFSRDKWTELRAGVFRISPCYDPFFGQKLSIDWTVSNRSKTAAGRARCFEKDVFSETDPSASNSDFLRLPHWHQL